MAKKGTKIGYTSKGQRRNVARKTVNMMRRERRANPRMEDVLKRMAYREAIINRPRGDKEKELSKRYDAEDKILLQAEELMDHYRDVGLPRSAAIQAAKTNFSEQLHAKWGPRLRKFRDAEKTGQKEQFIKQLKN